MNRTETIKTMAVLKAAYPNYYSRQSDEELNCIVSLWEEMLQDLPYELVSAGLKHLIKTRTDTFPPNIAELRESVSVLTNDGQTDADMWNLIAKACKNGYYGSTEEFNKLPPDCQRWVGSPENLREFSQLDLKAFSFIRGQFLKTFPDVKKSGEALRTLPAEVRSAIQQSKQRLLED